MARPVADLQICVVQGPCSTWDILSTARIAPDAALASIEGVLIVTQRAPGADASCLGLAGWVSAGGGGDLAYTVLAGAARACDAVGAVGDWVAGPCCGVAAATCLALCGWSGAGRGAT